MISPEVYDQPEIFITVFTNSRVILSRIPAAKILIPRPKPRLRSELRASACDSA